MRIIHKYAAAALANTIDSTARFQVVTGVFSPVEKAFWAGDFKGLAALKKNLMKIGPDARWNNDIDDLITAYNVSLKIQSACHAGCHDGILRPGLQCP